MEFKSKLRNDLTAAITVNSSVPEELQRLTIVNNIPTFVYLLLVGFMGIAGNALILIVYFRKKNRTATIQLILSLAVVDLFTNVFIIPVNFIVLYKGLTHSQGYFCKVFFFLNYSTALTAVIFLLEIAVVRYIKVCAPLGAQINRKDVKFFIFLGALLSIVSSVPFTVVHGLQKKESTKSVLLGYQCGVDSTFLKTVWPNLINLFTICLFTLCSIALSIMYLRIGLKARRHQNSVGKRLNSRATASTNKTFATNVGSSELTSMSGNVFMENDANKASVDVKIDKYPQKVPSSTTDSYADSELKIKSSSKAAQTRSKRIMGHTTSMLLTITVIFIVTNMTTLVIIYLEGAAFRVSSGGDQAVSSVLNLFICSFLINSTVNPIFYSYWNRDFRRQSRKLLRC